MNRDEKQTTAWMFTMVLEELSHGEELDSAIRGLLFGCKSNLLSTLKP